MTYTEFLAAIEGQRELPMCTLASAYWCRAIAAGHIRYSHETRAYVRTEGAPR